MPGIVRASSIPARIQSAASSSRRQRRAGPGRFFIHARVAGLPRLARWGSRYGYLPTREWVGDEGDAAAAVSAVGTAGRALANRRDEAGASQLARSASPENLKIE